MLCAFPVSWATGTITRSALDAAALLGAIAGSDHADPTAVSDSVPDYVAALDVGRPGATWLPPGLAGYDPENEAILRFDPQAPDWPDRDRFVLSNGHGSMLLYGLLHLTGYPDMTLDELKRFRQIGSRTAGHPERGLATGIETTTGPLGQGLGNSVGMALAERHLAAEFGEELVDHHTYVFCGDGCLMEGISHEALSIAGHLRLNKLIVFWDDNSISIDGPTDLAVSDDQIMRARAHGWNAERIDGMDHNAIAAAIRRAHASERPSLIACRTIIAYGAPTKAGTAAAKTSRVSMASPTRSPAAMKRGRRASTSTNAPNRKRLASAKVLTIVK